MFFSLATALPLLHNEPLFPQGKHAAWLEGADPNRPQAEAQAPGPAYRTSGGFAAQALGRRPTSAVLINCNKNTVSGPLVPSGQRAKTEPARSRKRDQASASDVA